MADDRATAGADASEPCHSCTGLLVWSAAMRSTGQRPMCIGRTGLVGEPRPDATEDPLPGDGDHFIHASVGYSQVTDKTRQEGHLPVCLYGLNVTLLRREQSRQEDGIHEAGSTSIAAAASQRVPVAPPVQWAPPTLASVSQALENQGKAIYRLWSNSSQDFGRSFQTSMSCTVQQMTIMPTRMMSFASKWWNGPYESGRQGR